MPDAVSSLLLDSNFINYWNLVEAVAELSGATVLKYRKCKFIKGSYAQANLYCRRGWVECEMEGGGSGVIVMNLDLQLISHLKELYPKSEIAICTLQEFFTLIEERFRKQAVAQAKSFVRFVNLSAAIDLPYGRLLLLATVLTLVSLRTFPTLFHLGNAFVSICQNIFKEFLLFTAIFRASRHAIPAVLEEYPIYTILIPAYREPNLTTVLDAISRLFYPKHKLDVKLLVEEDDSITKSNLGVLPYYVHVVSIPASTPRTKPKAMNYAMPYALGRYITIYDAEDVPEPFQLVTALESFNSLPLDYICLQAKLRFYNMNENLLTKMMSLEYGVLFSLLVYGLSITNFPVPLGGTSNHFRTSTLSQIGWWDAYNVAEDADLGMRIFSYNYKVSVIDSFTSEEAPITLIAWIKQRSRWIKGYWQTFFTFLQHRNRYTFKQAIGVYNFVGFATYSQLIFPFAIFLTIFAESSLVRSVWLTANIVSISYTLLASAIGIKKIGLAEKWYEYPVLAFCYSAYFILHFLASVLALLELVTAPFSWNKTQHGVSRVVKELNTKLQKGRLNE